MKKVIADSQSPALLGLSAHRLGSLVLASLLLNCLGCGMKDVEGQAPLQHQIQAIVNGTTDWKHPEVGILLANGQFCAATLIAPNAVLSAAHCLVDKAGIWNGSAAFRSGGAGPYSKISGDNNPGERPGSQTRAQQLRDVIIHPEYGTKDVFHADLAIGILTDPINDIEVIPVTSDRPARGDEIETVGYGTTTRKRSDEGTRQITTNTISTITSDYFEFDDIDGNEGVTCSGDSGGPVFATKHGKAQIIGINTASTCDSHLNLWLFNWDRSTSRALRADIYRSWIHDVLRAHPLRSPPQRPATQNAALTILEPQDGRSVAPQFSLAFRVNEREAPFTFSLFVNDTLWVSGASSRPQSDLPTVIQVDLNPGIYELRLAVRSHSGAVHSASQSLRVIDSGQNAAQAFADPSRSSDTNAAGSASTGCSFSKARTPSATHNFPYWLFAIVIVMLSRKTRHCVAKLDH